MSELEEILARALDARTPLLDAKHEGALRLFNGFVEGMPALSIDLYARTLVVHDHADGEEGDVDRARAAADLVRARLPWIRAVVWKVRSGATTEARSGRLLFGEPRDVDRKVRENGVAYAIALLAGKDASFYLDTRLLRAWLKENAAGKRVLNTFAHTGSLGVAARAAPASEVIHVDKSRAFLDLAKQTYSMNGFPIRRADFRAEDFFAATSRLRKEGGLFDCVLVDPPFYSDSAAGRVDLAAEPTRVIDKVRPLVAHEGVLVAVNNALYLSGADYLKALENVCADGYASIERLVPVPDDFAGFAETRRGALPVDPAPFNHSTKIAILRMRRKDGRRA